MDKVRETGTIPAVTHTAPIADDAGQMGQVDNASPQSNDVMGWYDFLEDSLASWAEQAQGYRLMHEKAFSHYSKISFNLTIPAIILSTLTGVANFGQQSLSPYLGDDAPLFIGVLSIAAAILSTIAKYVRADEKAETHRNAMINWDKLYRTIVTELTQPRKARISAQEFLLSYREERHRLTEQAPTIPYKIRKWFKEEYKDDYANSNISKPNILSLVDVQIFRGDTMTYKGGVNVAASQKPHQPAKTPNNTPIHMSSPAFKALPARQPISVPVRIETATQDLTSAEDLIKRATTMISGISKPAAAAAPNARHVDSHGGLSLARAFANLGSRPKSTSPSRLHVPVPAPHAAAVFSLATQQATRHIMDMKKVAEEDLAAHAKLAEEAVNDAVIALVRDTESADSELAKEDSSSTTSDQV